MTWQPAPRMPSSMPGAQRRIAWVAVLTVALLSYWSFADVPHLTGIQHVLIALIVLMGAMPSVIYVGNPHYSSPLFPLHGLFYAVTFGASTMIESEEWYRIIDSAKTKAFLIVLGGLLMLYAGYLLSAIFVNAPKVLSRSFPKIQQKYWEYAGWCGCALYASTVIFPPPENVPSVMHLVRAIGLFGLVLLLRLHFTKEGSRLSSILLIGAYVPFLILEGFVTGSLAQVLLIFLLGATVYWQCRKRIPWLAAFVTVAFLFLMNPVKGEYRQHVWFGGEYALSNLQKASLFVDLAEEHYLGGATALRDEIGTNVGRISNMLTMAWVAELTPEYVPYWNGDTLLPLFTGLIPRFLYPDKPKSSFGGEFGHRYGLVAVDNDTTAYNIPWIVEFYANFGTTGAMISMLLCGVLFRLLLECFARPDTPPLLAMAGLSITYSLSFAESNFALMWSGLLLQFLAIVMFLKTLQLLFPHWMEGGRPRGGIGSQSG